MTSDQRAVAQALLDSSGTEFLTLIASLTPAQWTAQPASGWTIAQIAEHVVLAEVALLRKVKALLLTAPAEALAEAPASLETLKTILAGRKGRVEAPAPLHPAGTWTQAETTERFLAHRDEARAFIASSEQPLEKFHAPNAFFGPLTAWQWFIYAPMHTQRHLLQIREILQSQ